MSTYFLVLPQAKSPILSFLESVKNKMFLETNADNVVTNEEEAEAFLKTAQTCLNESFLSLMKHLFSYKEKLLKDQKLFLNMVNIINLNISSQKDSAEKDALVAEYIKNVKELPEGLFSVKARMLSSLFNSFSIRDPQQSEILKEILKLTDVSKKVSIILPTIEKVDEYLLNWGLFSDCFKKRELYQLILNALYNNNREKIAIDIFVKYLRTFEEAQEKELTNSQDTAFIVSNIKRFLMSDEYHYEVFETIIHLKRVIQIEDKRLFEVLVLYVTGNLHGYFKWLESNHEYLQTNLGIDPKKLEVKIRIKCLATFEETGKPVTFKEMAEKLHVKEDEVEDWVILGIQNKIIEGKIDEFSKVIEITDNSSKYLERQDIERLEKKLEGLIGVFEGYMESLRKKKGN